MDNVARVVGFEFLAAAVAMGANLFERTAFLDGAISADDEVVSRCTYRRLVRDGVLLLAVHVDGVASNVDHVELSGESMLLQSEQPSVTSVYRSKDD